MKINSKFKSSLHSFTIKVLSFFHRFFSIFFYCRRASKIYNCVIIEQEKTNGIFFSRIGGENGNIIPINNLRKLQKQNFKQKKKKIEWLLAYFLVQVKNSVRVTQSRIVLALIFPIQVSLENKKSFVNVYFGSFIKTFLVPEWKFEK